MTTHETTMFTLEVNLDSDPDKVLAELRKVLEKHTSHPIIAASHSLVTYKRIVKRSFPTSWRHET